MVPDSFNLDRFVRAQDHHGFRQVCSELRNGHKQGHWMWFVFPQLKGLGRSSMAITFAISSRSEAEAYLAHPILGTRLRECTQLVNLVEGRSIHQIFGYPDEMKFRSSMTLFANVATENDIFRSALQKYFDGKPASNTISLLHSDQVVE